jgi:hypothetical protein
MSAGTPEAAVQCYEAFRASGGLFSAEIHLHAAKAYAATGSGGAALRHLVQIVDRDESTYAIWLAASRTLDRLPEIAFESLSRRLSVVVLSTWNTREYTQFLRLAAARCGISISVTETPYGQYFNFPLDPASELFAQRP